MQPDGSYQRSNAPFDTPKNAQQALINLYCNSSPASSPKAAQ